jgi:hypothetical protein
VANEACANPLCVSSSRELTTCSSLEAPKLWPFYGSNDGINYEEIPNPSNYSSFLIPASYPGGMYENVVNSNTKIYLYTGIVVNKLAGNDIMLNVDEIERYVK